MTIATAMLRQFRERNFILSLFGGGVYGFVHRAFLEYFCADDLRRGVSSMHLCTFRPARRCPGHRQTPATRGPAPACRGRDPVSVPHGSSAQQCMTTKTQVWERGTNGFIREYFPKGK